jgi:nucleoside diphosphate kinase homolog 5
MERTLAMIKPDGLSGKYTEAIKEVILDSGFHIVKETEVQLDAERASVFYAEHSQRSFFDSLVKYITRYYCCWKGSCLLSFLHNASSLCSSLQTLTLTLTVCNMTPFIFVLIFSGPVLAMVLERPDAVAQWRTLIGPTDAKKAKTSHPNRLKTTFVFL